MSHNTISGRTLRDADLNTDIAGPAVNANVQSAVFDLGTEDKNDNYEASLQYPELSDTNLPNGATLTLELLTGATNTPTTSTASLVLTGNGETIPAGHLKLRVPVDAPQYARLKVTGVNNGNLASLTFGLGLRF